MRLITQLLPAVALLSSAFAFAQETQKVNPADSLQQKAERGWFFYEDPVKPKTPPKKKEQAAKTDPEASKDDPCQKPATWTAKCGFVDPGKDFDFQAKQRVALLENMTMSQNDPKAVEAFQYYMKWVMGRATEVANLWYYNMVQNPDLDASVNQPVSAFGLRLMTDVKKGHSEEIFNSLRKDDAMLVYFTRSDCRFCHDMAPTVKRIATKTSLPVWNAALDDQCIEGFEKMCRTRATVEKPAQALQVTIVPTLFLHVPPATWLRISTGVTDEESVLARTVSFFSAYRSALLKGVDNGSGNRPAVDFSGEDELGGTAVGVRPAKAPRAPSEDEVRKLLGSK